MESIKNQPKNQTYADVAVIPNSIGKEGKVGKFQPKQLLNCYAKNGQGN
jgi:hypothetical protein